ncbi:MAG TPA: gamma-glutamylcyclotransferase family protein [Microbacterium sp.]|nr:gamma-glutamylcyclotransferase family protein [Microbacterium sp.]
MMHRLFVYGSLAPGRANEHVLADVDGIWELATVAGELRHHGWGADIGFPGIVLGASSHAAVDGFLFSSEQLGDQWERLDAFEGEEYERVVAEVTRRDGSTIDAHIYALRRTPESSH